MQYLATLYEAQVALNTTQEGLGQLLGVSRRTVNRWQETGNWQYAIHTRELARLIYPKDPALAAKFAQTGGDTLESLGLRVPPPPPPPKMQPMPRAVDVVVCALAEALDGSPRAVRPALLAAVRAAKEVGLDLDGIEQALAPKTRSKGKE